MGLNSMTVVVDVACCLCCSHLLARNAHDAFIVNSAICDSNKYGNKISHTYTYFK